MDKFFILFGIKLGRNELNFSGSLNNTGSGTQFNFSSKLRAILHHLEKISTTNSSIKKLNEFVVEDREYEEEGMKRNAEHLLPEKIEVEKDIFCEVSIYNYVAVSFHCSAYLLLSIKIVSIEIVLGLQKLCFSLKNIVDLK